MANSATAAVLTTGRQDWGLLRPLCEQLVKTSQFELQVIAGGMAVESAFGSLTEKMRVAGFVPAATIPWDVQHASAAVQASQAMAGVDEALGNLAPGFLVLLGDRFETLAAAVAATLRQVPIVHLYGGEETEGAYDNSMRHAITKLSHLHFVAHEVYRDRIVQMGEESRSVHVVGSLGVDNIVRMELPTLQRLEADLGVSLEPPLGLVTVHPTTLGGGADDTEMRAVIRAMQRSPGTWIVTLPNADPGNDVIRELALEAAAGSEHIHCFTALGEARYLGLMRQCQYVLGNSSSGMIEAPAMRKPTVNVGDRQRGRLRFPSIIDIGGAPDEILRGLERARSPAHMEICAQMEAPLGDGTAAMKIVEVLSHWTPPRPPRKCFVDRAAGASTQPTGGHGVKQEQG